MQLLDQYRFLTKSSPTHCRGLRQRRALVCVHAPAVAPTHFTAFIIANVPYPSALRLSRIILCQGRGRDSVCQPFPRVTAMQLQLRLISPQH